MSRSNPTLTSPAQHFMSWQGSTGQLTWYNKETKTNVPVKLPFKFMVLDQLATIKGYNKPAKAGYWSNEVRNTRKEELIVRLGNQTVYVGMYKNKQGTVQVPKGADYTQSVYIAHKIGDQYVLGNINMKGSSRSAWFEFTGSCKPENGTVTMLKGDVQTAQTGDFYPPIFTYNTSTDEENVVAVKLDTELQVYLSQYFAAAQVDQLEQVPDGDIDPTLGLATEEQTVDYNNRRTSRAPVTTEYSQEPMPDYTDEPINLDDIPF